MLRVRICFWLMDLYHKTNKPSKDYKVDNALTAMSQTNQIQNSVLDVGWYQQILARIDVRNLA